MRTQKNNLSNVSRRNVWYDDNEDEEERRRYRNREGGWLKSCCCSYPALSGLVIGLLILGIAIGPVITLLITKVPESSGGSTTFAANVGSTASTTPQSTLPTSTTTSSTGIVASTTSTTTTTATTTPLTTGTTTTTTTTTTTAPYCLTRVTFDNIPGQVTPSGVVPNGYDNFNWTNAVYLDASTVPNSGYQTLNSATSPPYVAYNPGGGVVTIRSANGTKFSFDSVVLAASWRDGLSWTLQGYRSATLWVSGSFPINSMNRTTISCSSCTGLDRLVFSATGGIPRPGLAENGTEFAFDDLCISFGY